MELTYLLGSEAELKACDFIEVLKSFGPNTDQFVGNMYPVFMTREDDDRIDEGCVHIMTEMNMGKPGDKFRCIGHYMPLDCVRLVTWQRKDDWRYDKMKAMKAMEENDG